MGEVYKSVTGLVAPTAILEPADPLAPEIWRKPGLQYCAFCNSLIVGKPHVIKEKDACTNCAAEGLRQNPAERRKAFVGGLLFGLAAAVLASAFCTLFGVLTHLDVNFTAPLVGWLIGSGMMQGSNGARGPRYQFAAAALTYFTVSLSSIPIYLIPVVFWLPQDFRWDGVLEKLAYWAVASPMLAWKNGLAGCAGLFILFIGMRLATRITRADWQGTSQRSVEKKEEAEIGV